MPIPTLSATNTTLTKPTARGDIGRKFWCSPPLKRIMPYTHVYEDITRKCESCGRALVARTIEVSSELLRIAYHCNPCDSGCTAYYLLGDGCYANERIRFSGERTWKIRWACEHGCGWILDATRIETSAKFLRITFRCEQCHGQATRYYDLERHGFADVTGHVVPLVYPYNQPKSENRTWYAGVKECETMEHCPLLHVSRLAVLVNLGPVARRIGGIVATVVENCPGMDEQQIAGCFGRLLGTAPLHRSERKETSDLRDQQRESFRRAYQHADEEK